MDGRVYVEEWQSHYGTPLHIDSDLDSLAGGELVEEHDSFALDPDGSEPPARLAFVDGVRRGDAYLYLEDPSSGALAHGVAGAHARGAALWEAGVMRCGHIESNRLVIWGSGFIADLPEVSGGYRWQSASVADPDHDAPLRELQRRMRLAEGQLAESLATENWTVVCDGPLNFVRSTDLPVCGFVKTHHRPLLAAEHHAKIATLQACQRSPLFCVSDRYSCYLRLVERRSAHGPWHGIARLEFPQSAGLEEAARVADQLAATLPRFAGISHIDPRAPQNLQPIGALEEQLKRRLGHPHQAAMAVREAARRLRGSQEQQTLKGRA
ncbi:MAG: hypothetical protein ACRDF6_08870 [bacterium]